LVSGESSLALKSGGVNFYDSKTSTPETTVLDLTATTSGSINPEVHKDYFRKDMYLEKVYTATASEIQGEGKTNAEDLKDHFKKDLYLDTVYTVAASGIQGGGEINPEDHFRKDLYLDTVYKKPEKYLFYCSKCKASIEMVLIRREEEMIKCPTCSEFVKFIGIFTF
jgi:DNA-directed RNA polymerase subunit RPC12/RpoP